MTAILRLLRGTWNFLWLLAATLVFVVPFYIIVFFKLIIPIKGFRDVCSKGLEKIAIAWSKSINWMITLTTNIHWDIRGADDLDIKEWTLVTSNHLSYIDVWAMLKAATGPVPFYKFFIKRELLYVPLLGLCWWGMDYIFMRRYSKEQLAKNPELKGKDIETTRKTIQRIAHPTSIVNYLEGTRLTAKKHAAQSSPYQHLLKPKSGGVAYMFGVMNGRIRDHVDVTIVYPGKTLDDLGFWGYLAGDFKHIIVDLHHTKIPDEILFGDYENDPEYRQRLQDWVTAAWQRKDALIETIKAEAN